jgi:hypothetical protein
MAHSRCTVLTLSFGILASSDYSKPSPFSEVTIKKKVKFRAAMREFMIVWGKWGKENQKHETYTTGIYIG